MRIQGYSYKQVAVEDVTTHLYPHQAAMYNEWQNHAGFLLVTKTGSGKTRATALPVLKNHESAVFAYPTNALIQDQSRAIQQLMDDEGITYRERTPETANERAGTEEYEIVQINAPTLSAFAKAWGMGEKQKGAALIRLIQQDKRKIVLINPDILYLLYSLRYRGSQEVLSHFQAYETIVFDEFHLYNGVELAHALFLIFLARRMGAFHRVVLLSATPNEEVKTYLDRLLNPFVVDADVTVPQPIYGERTVAYNVELNALPLLGMSSQPHNQRFLNFGTNSTGFRQKTGKRTTRETMCLVSLSSIRSSTPLHWKMPLLTREYHAQKSHRFAGFPHGVVEMSEARRLSSAQRQLKLVLTSKPII